MILDKKLQLASNLDIATRNQTGTLISSLLPAGGLGDVGNGETLYGCVTVTESFAASTGNTFPSLFAFSIRHSLSAFPDIIDSSFTDSVAAMYSHRLQPLIGQTHYIPNTGDNFVAGKRFLFPLSFFSYKAQFMIGLDNSAPVIGPVPALVPNDFVPGQEGSYIYAVVEETGAGLQTALAHPASSYPVNQTASGRVDIDIVTISEPGAGPGFSDGYYYPVRAQVR